VHTDRENTFPLTAVLLTLNEEVNVAACLATLAWVDDVVVVDSGSRDDTVERVLAARPDARVFTHAFKDFGDQRNWALDHAEPRHEWVLFLDADERCTPACAEAIRRALTPDSKVDGYYLTCRNMFLGQWIRRCTFYPSWQLRLLRMGRVRFRKEGHGQREIADGPLGYIREPYDHFGFSKGVEEWVSRHNRYSTNEVELIQRLRAEPLHPEDLVKGDPVVRRRALKRLAARLGFRPLLRFLYMYILRAGFLDGRAGWVFCRLRVAHEIHIEAKLKEAATTACT
jgi:glycosyltransferase involved in cell wall biosynthesis